MVAMLIVWRGLGYLVAVIVFGSSLAMNLIFNAAIGERYYDRHKWPCALSFVFSALILWFLGNHLRQRSDRIVVDKESGEEFVVNQSEHSLFFIPVHLWTPILVAGAVALIAYDFLS